MAGKTVTEVRAKQWEDSKKGSRSQVQGSAQAHIAEVKAHYTAITALDTAPVSAVFDACLCVALHDSC